MRTAQIVGSGFLVLFLVPAAGAQPAPYSATITMPEVLVRSGPSLEFYPTCKLHQGESVSVLREENGWLAIKPPTGSFSWINDRLVEEPRGGMTVVSAPEAPVRVGSSLLNQPPKVERLKLARGTQLAVIGKPQTSDEGVWWPISPAPAEVRYLPPEAIKAGTGVPVTASAAPTVVPSTYTQAPAPPGDGINPLWKEADLVEREGNLSEAKRLYQQLADRVSLTDHELAVRCLKRIQVLQDRQRGVNTVSQQPAMDTPYPNPVTSGAQTPTPVNPNGLTAAAYSPQQRQACSQYCYAPDQCCQTVKLTAPGASSPGPGTSPGPSTQWYGPGRLYRTAFFLDGKPAYGLEPVNGQLRLYVTAAPGVNLQPYVERMVSLYGPVSYRGDVRTNYMTAMQVSPNP